MRPDDYCPGAESCPQATTYHCQGCDETFRSETDPNGCPTCGGRSLEVERCDECPQRKLEAALGGGLGSLIQRAMQFESAAQIPIDIGPINCEEFAALLLLRECRLRHEAEQAKQNP